MPPPPPPELLPPSAALAPTPPTVTVSDWPGVTVTVPTADPPMPPVDVREPPPLPPTAVMVMRHTLAGTVNVVVPAVVNGC